MYQSTNRSDETVGDIEAAVLAGIETSAPHQIGGDGSALYVVRDADGDSRVIDTRERDDLYLEHPRRKHGTYQVTQVQSFLDYIARHGTDNTEVFVENNARMVRGVIDSHAPSTAGYETHKVDLTFPRSDQWAAWTAYNGKKMQQAQFAEFIEDNLIDIVDPKAADMLEIVSSLSATTRATFHSAHRLSDGSTEFEWSQETSAKAGSKSGRLDIPARFQIGVPVFRGREDVRVEARFRYRISEGGLSMSYHLERPGEVEQAAFDLAIGELAADLDETYPVFVN